MKAENLSMEDAVMIRALLDFPGGLELHIGVSILCSYNEYWCGRLLAVQFVLARGVMCACKLLVSHLIQPCIFCWDEPNPMP